MYKYLLPLLLIGCSFKKPLVTFTDLPYEFKDKCRIDVTKNCGATIYDCDLYEGIIYCVNKVQVFE